MNANELADELENTYPFVGVMEIAATMLRQQQAEIEELKAAKIRAYNNGVEDGRKPDTNNEPIAWMREDGVIAFHAQKEMDSQGYKWFPLYIHPVKEQDESFDRTASHMVGEYVSYKAELTDEEIGDFEHQIIRACGLSTANSDINPIGIRQIIKEILRKAQEK